MICLLNVFTPDSTLEKFDTLWVSRWRECILVQKSYACHDRLKDAEHVWMYLCVIETMCSMQIIFFILNHFVDVSDFLMLRFFFNPSFIKQNRKTQWKIQTSTILKCLHFLMLLPSYMVMPFVAQDLGHIMKRKQLTSNVITYLFYQILRGLKVCLHSVHCNFQSSFW